MNCRITSHPLGSFKMASNGTLAKSSVGRLKRKVRAVPVGFQDVVQLSMGEDLVAEWASTRVFSIDFCVLFDLLRKLLLKCKQNSIMSIDLFTQVRIRNKVQERSSAGAWARPKYRWLNYRDKYLKTFLRSRLIIITLQTESHASR